MPIPADSFVRHRQTGQHWLVFALIYTWGQKDPKAVCFRNGVRQTFELKEVEVR